MSDGGTKRPAFKKYVYPNANVGGGPTGTIKGCLEVLDRSIRELEMDHGLAMRDKLMLLNHTRMLRGIIGRIK